jgi:hypothetical protein
MGLDFTFSLELDALGTETLGFAAVFLGDGLDEGMESFR